jgi:hypothetical protein
MMDIDLGRIVNNKLYQTKILKTIQDESPYLIASESNFRRLSNQAHIERIKGSDAVVGHVRIPNSREKRYRERWIPSLFLEREMEDSVDYESSIAELMGKRIVNMGVGATTGWMEHYSTGPGDFIFLMAPLPSSMYSPLIELERHLDSMGRSGYMP